MDQYRRQGPSVVLIVVLTVVVLVAVVGLGLLVSCVICAGVVSNAADTARSPGSYPAPIFELPPPVVTPVVPVSPPPPPDDGRTIREEKHFATFMGDILDECVDVYASVTKESAIDPEKIPNGREDLRKAIGKISTGTEIQRPCAEQFPGRDVLASCAFAPMVEKIDDLTLEVNIKGYNYNYGTVGENDTRMKECLDRSGSWWSMDHNSDEWQSIRIRYNAIKARGDLDRLMKRTGQR